MVEAVVGLLIGKLGAALAYEGASFGASMLFKEASALKGLFGEIREANVTPRNEDDSTRCIDAEE